MNHHRVLLPIVVAVLAVPAAAHANTLWHPAPGEAGFTYHPDHFKSAKSRAEVLAEVEIARKDGTLQLIQRSAALPVKNAGPAKSRQQVIDELRNESPQERRARVELMTGG